MNIVIGRGNSRKSYEVPAAEIVKRSTDKEQKTLVNNLCSLIGIKQD